MLERERGGGGGRERERGINVSLCVLGEGRWERDWDLRVEVYERLIQHRTYRRWRRSLLIPSDCATAWFRDGQWLAVSAVWTARLSAQRPVLERDWVEVTLDLVQLCKSMGLGMNMGEQCLSVCLALKTDCRLWHSVRERVLERSFW